MSTNSDDHTLVKHNDYQREVELDYADPESPTQKDPLTSVTSAFLDIHRTVAIHTDDTVQTSRRQSQGTSPTLASPSNGAAITTVPSPMTTSAETRTTRQRSSRESNDSAGEDIDSVQLDKRRRLDLGDLMVKPAFPA